MSQPLLSIRDLQFQRAGKPVLHGVDLDLQDGEVLFVVGPSGCGKTTLLRLIAGLEEPASGSVVINGQVISGNGTMLPPEKRPVGMVFQGLALFPHLTVAANIGFGLNKVNKDERRRRVQEELNAVGLEGLEQRYPHQLSGGQQQRVALARSLVLRPKVMLMDEPFSDLDSRTRSQVRTEVDRILQEHGTAAIIVSHDKEDAYHLGDRIAVMEEGRVVRVETADVMRHEWTEQPFGT
jgi:iron(III) transport system ATP-binding protein